LATAPLPLRGLVFLSATAARGRSLISELPVQAALKRLAAGQRYAAGQAGWRQFLDQAHRLPAFELRRGDSPAQAVAALEALLQQLRRRRTRRR